jgi:hypothetical protein
MAPGPTGAIYARTVGLGSEAACLELHNERDHDEGEKYDNGDGCDRSHTLKIPVPEVEPA